MLIFVRRTVRSWSTFICITSSPSTRILPAVGSWMRLSMRTSVDLPDPDSPMTTKTSPWPTSKQMSRTAATHPVFASSSARGRSASGVPTMRSALGP